METKDWVKIALKLIKAILLILAGGGGAMTLLG